MKLARSRITIVMIGLVSLVAVPAIYNLPGVQARVGWRVAEWAARLKYAVAPPEQVVFVPHDRPAQAGAIASPPPKINAVSGAPTRAALPAVPVPELTPLAKSVALPPSRQLTGFRHEYQTWNNCGPATLAMALSYWGWRGDQRLVAAFTKPNPRDKNVMPYELAAYVDEESKFIATVRVGGDIDILKRFIASGFPVMIEKGFEGPEFDGWMGHYVLVTGYSEPDQRFTVQDSYYGPDQVIGYEALESNWRAFDFTYLIVYPPGRQPDVTSILGRQADEEYNNRYAAQLASTEIYTLDGRNRFFAWFNRGTSLVRLQDYAGAAAAYDEAFSLYPSIPAKLRPWRMMWYQTGPYWAYYYSGRAQDVMDLATTTLDAMSEPVLEESYYWRALAREAAGDMRGAEKDLRASLGYHPGFEPAAAELQQMGVRP